MACTVRQSPCAWRSACRRCPTGGMGPCGVTGPMWAAALGGCEWLESWKMGRTLDDAVLDLVRRLADAPLPDPPPVLRALLGHTLDEVLLRGLTALYSLLGCEEQQRQPDGDSDGAAVSATWLDSQYRELAEDERRLGADHPSVRERQATLNQLSQLLRQSQRHPDPATSTAGTSSLEPSGGSSVEGMSDVAGATAAGGTDTGASDVGASEIPSSAASIEPEASPRTASTVQERRLTERRPPMPGWILPGVDESVEDGPTGGSAAGADEEGGGRTAKKVHFLPDEQARRISPVRPWAPAQPSAPPLPAQPSVPPLPAQPSPPHLPAQPSAPRLPCECCVTGKSPRSAPATPHAPCVCVCPCGKATRICVVKHPECVCDEPSSEYFTGRGTSAMPSRSDAASPEGKRKATEATELAREAAGTGDPAASKAAAKKASSVQSSAPSAPPLEILGDGASPETEWHSAMSTPQLKSSRPEPSGPGSGALWPRSTPCPCCPPRRRRPRGPGTCPEQILWAVTKICVFPDASRTYEVLTPSFEKPPRATGRAHVVFAMRPPHTLRRLHLDCPSR